MEAMDDIYSAICREALESRQRDLGTFVDNGMVGMSSRLEKTLLRLPPGHFLLGLGPYNAGLVKLDFDEVLLGREVPEFIGVGMPVTGFRVSSPDAFLNTEVSRLHAKVIRRVAGDGAELPARGHAVDLRHVPERRRDPGARRPRRRVRGRLRPAAAIGGFLLARALGREPVSLLPEVNIARLGAVGAAVTAVLRAAFPTGRAARATRRHRDDGRPGRGKPRPYDTEDGRWKMEERSGRLQNQAVGVATERASTSSSTSNWDGMIASIPLASQMPIVRSGGR